LVEGAEAPQKGRRVMRRIIVAAAVLAFLALTSAGSALSSDVTVYITRTGSCYHTAECSCLRSSAMPLSLTDAVERGYRPCKVCKPPAPDAPIGAATAPAETVEVPVVRVVDGDTIKVRYRGKLESVRLVGIDTPEITRGKNEPFGKPAGAFLEALLADRTVLLEFDVERRDRYGRLLAYVWAQGDGDPAPVFVNAQLARWGYAQLLTIPPNVKYVERLRNAVGAAKAARANLWRDIQ